MKTCPVCDTPYPDQHTNCPTDGAVLIVSHELAVGSMVRGKYRIIDKLGQGGMGVVYLAEDIMLGVRVALKFLSVELSKDPKFIKRFRNEARAAYLLRHPNIVEVTSLDQAEDGSLFIAMEYVQGSSLRSYHGDPEFADIPHPVERALAVTRDIAAGLAAAHAQGTVHRDIKPENILLTRAADGREHAKILDFGIAAMAESVTRVSMTHGILLTPEYAAPEQWLEMPAAEMDGRTDCYALGCVLYEMLTRHAPFHAHNTAGWMKQHLEESPKPPSQLRPDLADWVGLDALVSRLLAKNRDDRPRDAELLSLLDAVHYGPGEQRQQTVMAEAGKQPKTVIEEASVRQEPIPKPAPERPVQQQTVVDQEPAPQTMTAPASIPKEGGAEAKQSKKPRKVIKVLFNVVRCILGLILGVVIAGIGIGIALDNGSFTIFSVLPLEIGVCLIVAALPFKRLRLKIVLAAILFNLPLLVALIVWNDARLVSGLFLGMEILCLLVVAVWSKLPKIAAALIGVVFAAYAIIGLQAEIGQRVWVFFLLDVIVCLPLVITLFSPKFRLRLTPRALVPLGCLAVPFFLVAVTPLTVYLAASLGDRGGRELLGESYLPKAIDFEQFERDAARSLSLLDINCDSAMDRACMRLGDIYESGDEVAKNLEMAAQYYTHACKLGSLSGCDDLVRLGDKYKNGEDVSKDEDHAGKLYQLACGGFYSGCDQLFNVAYDFSTGHGVPVNKVKSAAFYASACDGGNYAACTNLGVQYDRGEGVKLDLAKAADLFQKACDGNNAQSCSNLGIDYWSGSGVKQDKAKGKALLQKGCKMDNKWGCDQLKSLQ